MKKAGDCLFLRFFRAVEPQFLATFGGVKNRIVGIDLGTTNSAVAVVDSGFPIVLADNSGRRTTPSVVRHEEAEALVGEEAKRGQSAAPASTIYSVKRFIGRRLRECEDDARSMNYAITADKQGRALVNSGGRSFSPEQVSSEILKHLKQVAEKALGEEVSRAVITVPAYFNDAQRQATIEAGKLAGLAVERILNEPTAAALAYGLDKLADRSKVAVYDLGGGTFDLSILELTEGTFQVLATNGDTRLGGDDIDRRLADWLEAKAAEAGGFSAKTLSLEAKSRIREAAEKAKIQLSQAEEFEVLIPFLTPGFSFQHTVARHDLERLARPVIEKTKLPCRRALADAKIAIADLSRVILVGGQTRMPLLRRLVGEWFECAEFESAPGELRVGEDFHRPAGPTLDASQHPDESVALGAAIQGAILAGDLTKVLLLDVTPLSLGIETFGGLMNVIIPRNSTIPVKAGETFTTAVDRQREMLIHLLQGEREKAKDNWSLGKFAIEFDEAPRGVPRVGVQFEIDANGVLQVLARDIRTGKEKTQKVQSAVDVDDAKVQQMVEESVHFALEDLAERRWIEACLKAKEIVQATAQALQSCGEELEESERRKIQQALQAVRQMLQSKENKKSAGNWKALQKQTQILDKQTHRLAEIQMQKAMEELMRQRGLA